MSVPALSFAFAVPSIFIGALSFLDQAVLKTLYEVTDIILQQHKDDEFLLWVLCCKLFPLIVETRAYQGLFHISKEYEPLNHTRAARRRTQHEIILSAAHVSVLCFALIRVA
jgi:hypothetical protein